MRSDLDISLNIDENNPMEKLTRSLARIIHLSRSSRRKEAPFFSAAPGQNESEPAIARRLKRHGAAALQDARASSKSLLFPPGLGVRQPYAAFVARIGGVP